MKSNSRAYNRDVSKRKALRKRRITKEVYGDLTHPYYDNLHQYSKNKIHCSCPMCSAKSKNRGRRPERRGIILLLIIGRSQICVNLIRWT